MHLRSSALVKGRNGGFLEKDRDQPELKQHSKFHTHAGEQIGTFLKSFQKSNPQKLYIPAKNSYMYGTFAKIFNPLIGHENDKKSLQNKKAGFLTVYICKNTEVIISLN